MDTSRKANATLSRGMINRDKRMLNWLRSFSARHASQIPTWCRGWFPSHRPLERRRSIIDVWEAVLGSEIVISDSSSFGVPYTNGSGSYTLTLKGMASSSNTGFCSSNLDLGHTLNIVGLQILDSSGNAVSGATVMSQSGLNYLALPGTIDAQTAVPEPKTLPIALLAAVATWWARRPRRTAHLSS